LFRGQQALLASHCGYDAGALHLATTLAAALRAPLAVATISRLVVDLNRSLGHRQLFSPPIRALPPAERAAIIAAYYRPYRDEVERRVGAIVARGQRTIHVSAHSFTPVLDGQARRADVGLLYDPARPGEALLCARWKAALADLAPMLIVRRNYPYQGKCDGLTAHLRQRYADSDYVGIELEVNQRIVAGGCRRWAALVATLVESLRSTLAA
jgi:predicted N-formylglutamate amidohydrolase